MPSAKKNVPAYLAAVIAAVIFGFSFLFTRNALNRLDIFQLLGYRFLAAAVLLTILAAFGAIRIRVTLSKLRPLLLVALLQPVLYFVGETIGVKLTSASESGIMIAMVPIAITVCSVLLLHEKLSVRKWISVSVSVTGALLIVLSKGFQGGSGHLAGTAALVGAVVAAGLYNVLSKKASEQSTPMEITFVMMWTGAIVFNGIGLAVAAANGTIGAYFSQLGNGAVLIDIGYLGVLSSVVAFFCFNYALSRLESTVIGTIANITPIVSVLAGVFIAGESLLILQVIGSAFILAGIWGMTGGKAQTAGAPLPAQPE